MLLLLYVPQQQLSDRPWSPAANLCTLDSFLMGLSPSDESIKGKTIFLGFLKETTSIQHGSVVRAVRLAPGIGP